MKSYKHYWLFFILLLLSCKSRYHATKQDYQQYKVTASELVSADSMSEIERYLKPFRDSLNLEMNVVIGNSEADFEKGKSGGTLGRLVVQALEEASQTMRTKPITGVITNPGGLRINQIPKGPITVGKIFELLPFENELVIVAVPGHVLAQWMTLMEEKGGWPKTLIMPYAKENEQVLQRISSKLIKHLSDSPAEQYIRSHTAMKADSIYYIATNDYVANGGDNCDFLKTCKKENTGLLLRTLLMNYIKQTQSVHLVYSKTELDWLALFQTDAKSSN